MIFIYAVGLASVKVGPCLQQSILLAGSPWLGLSARRRYVNLDIFYETSRGIACISTFSTIYKYYFILNNTFTKFSGQKALLN